MFNCCWWFTHPPAILGRISWLQLKIKIWVCVCVCVLGRGSAGRWLQTQLGPNSSCSHGVKLVTSAGSCQSSGYRNPPVFSSHWSNWIFTQSDRRQYGWTLYADWQQHCGPAGCLIGCNVEYWLLHMWDWKLSSWFSHVKSNFINVELFCLYYYVLAAELLRELCCCFFYFLIWLKSQFICAFVSFLFWSNQKIYGIRQTEGLRAKSGPDLCWVRPQR